MFQFWVSTVNYLKVCERRWMRIFCCFSADFLWCSIDWALSSADFPWNSANFWWIQNDKFRLLFQFFFEIVEGLLFSRHIILRVTGQNKQFQIRRKPPIDKFADFVKENKLPAKLSLWWQRLGLIIDNNHIINY